MLVARCRTQPVSLLGHRHAVGWHVVAQLMLKLVWTSHFSPFLTHSFNAQSCMASKE